MKYFAIIAVLLGIQVLAGAETYCNPERSKPCGAGCITLEKTCRKPWTTSKVGINPNSSSKKGYEKPEFVTVRPK